MRHRKNSFGNICLTFVTANYQKMNFQQENEACSTFIPMLSLNSLCYSTQFSKPYDLWYLAHVRQQLFLWLDTATLLDDLDFWDLSSLQAVTGGSGCTLSNFLMPWAKLNRDICLRSNWLLRFDVGASENIHRLMRYSRTFCSLIDYPFEVMWPYSRGFLVLEKSKMCYLETDDMTWNGCR